MFVTVTGATATTTAEILKMLFAAVVERRRYGGPGITDRAIQAATAAKNAAVNGLRGHGDLGEVRNARGLGEEPTAIVDITGSLSEKQLDRLNRLALAAGVKYQIIEREIGDRDRGYSIQYPTRHAAAMSELIDTVMRDAVGKEPSITDAGRVQNVAPSVVQDALGGPGTDITDQVNMPQLFGAASDAGIDVRVYQSTAPDGTPISQFEFAAPNEAAFDSLSNSAVAHGIMSKEDILDALTKLEDRGSSFTAGGVDWTITSSELGPDGKRILTAPAGSVQVSTVLSGNGVLPIATARFSAADGRALVAASDAAGAWEIRDVGTDKAIMEGKIAGEGARDKAWRAAREHIASLREPEKGIFRKPESFHMNSAKLAAASKKAVEESKKREAIRPAPKRSPSHTRNLKRH
ncbi:MAG: hypothetical protein SOU51_01080 [Collinsella sp.]|nr:hypothetical protein [Collinsella sp.]